MDGGISTLTTQVHTAESILDAGEFLFQRQGYHGTSMRQLARFAGVTPAAIYNHYPSKEDIFVALLKARLPHRALALAVQQAEGDDAEELLRDGIRRMREAMEDRFDSLRLGFIEVLEFEGRHLPLVLPEILTPAISFLERLRESDPRQTWSPFFLLRVIGGAFAALAISASYLRGIEGMAGTLEEFDDLAAVLAAGLLRAPTRAGQAEAPR